MSAPVDAAAGSSREHKAPCNNGVTPRRIIDGHGWWDATDSAKGDMVTLCYPESVHGRKGRERRPVAAQCPVKALTRARGDA